jgi:putative ABC transport system ATP-binding protein
MKVIEAKNIKKEFRMGQQTLKVLKGVSFSINKGEMVSITGQSGSGKSTLMTILGCLDYPTSGSFLIDGKETSKMSSDERANLRNLKIGFVFQQFNLLPNLTALQNIILPKLYAGTSEKQAMEEGLEQIRAVRLEKWSDHYPYQLSGGQQQRVAVARSLANKPPIILADEPTGNLDSETGKSIIELFNHINQKYGVTVIMVTHDPKIASESPRVIEISDGMIV